MTNRRHFGPCAVTRRVLAAAQHIGAVALGERHRTAREIERAHRVLARRHALEQRVDLRVRAERLEHEFERAAAGQAELERILGGHAVLHALRLVVGERAAAHAVDEVVLDAAARDRARHQAVVADHHVRADGTRRRAPGTHDGAQYRAPSGTLPLVGLLRTCRSTLSTSAFRRSSRSCPLVGAQRSASARRTPKAISATPARRVASQRAARTCARRRAAAAPATTSSA